jgi:hypothetical protein
MLMEFSVVCLGRMYPPPSQSPPHGKLLRLIRKVIVLSLCHAKWDRVLIVTLRWNFAPYSDIIHCSSTGGPCTAARRLNLTPGDGLWCVRFAYPVLCWFWWPEIRHYLGRVVAQAVSRWLPTVAARFRVRAACGVCGGQSGTEAGFLRVLQFPLPIIPPFSPSS